MYRNSGIDTFMSPLSLWCFINKGYFTPCQGRALNSPFDAWCIALWLKRITIYQSNQLTGDLVIPDTCSIELTGNCSTGFDSFNSPHVTTITFYSERIVPASGILYGNLSAYLWSEHWNDNWRMAFKKSKHSIINRPVSIRVRIDPPYTLICRRGGHSDETGKTEVTCHSRCGTIKIPPCSKVLSAEHRPKFCRPSPVMSP
jgi:hypothetical protein